MYTLRLKKRDTIYKKKWVINLNLESKKIIRIFNKNKVMTQEQFENKHAEVINYLIDLTNEITEVWKYHPENPNRVDVVQYHEILVNKIAEVEQQERDLVAKYGNV